MIYSTDLNDAEWALIKHHFEQNSSKRGRKPYRNSIRDVLNAIFYLLKTGCQWRMLPFHFPPWQTVYSYFRKMQKSGLFGKIQKRLVKKVRIKQERSEDPTVGVIDSQSMLQRSSTWV